MPWGLGTRLGFRRARDVYMFIRPCFMTFSIYTMTLICLYAHNGKGSILEEDTYMGFNMPKCSVIQTVYGFDSDCNLQAELGCSFRGSTCISTCKHVCINL